MPRCGSLHHPAGVGFSFRGAPFWTAHGVRFPADVTRAPRLTERRSEQRRPGLSHLMQLI